MTDVRWKQRIRQLLDDRGLSMRAASIAAGRGETYVRDILERDHQPGAANLKALARSLGVPVDDLFDANNAEDDPIRRRLQNVFNRLADASPAIQNEVANYAEYLLGEAKASKKRA
jgi:transcriptional regulator with XRE-family HTH domain